MLNGPTFDKLSTLRLSAMGREYRRQLESPDTVALSFEDRFGMLVDAEWLSRHNSRLKKLLRLACLRIPNACLEDVDYDPRRKLDRGYIARLADCTWIAEHRNMIITGATGTGKTFLGSAFGNAACRQDWKTKYYRVNRLLSDLAVGHGDGSYNRLMRDLKKMDLLILDDFGMATLDPVAGRDLLEVIEDRSGLRATIISKAPQTVARQALQFPRRWCRFNFQQISDKLKTLFEVAASCWKRWPNPIGMTGRI